LPCFETALRASSLHEDICGFEGQPHAEEAARRPSEAPGCHTRHPGAELGLLRHAGLLLLLQALAVAGQESLGLGDLRQLLGDGFGLARL